MFVDAAAIIAILSGEAEAERCSKALMDAPQPLTSAIAVWEATIALARADKFDLPIPVCLAYVTEFLETRNVAIRDMPPPTDALSLSLDAATRYRTGKRRLNLADCFHYACAKFYDVPILSTADEFRFTDLETIA